jgi:two-component system, chemotaxis family, sensor kinase Cph1
MAGPNITKKIQLYACILGFAWTAVLAGSFAWYYQSSQKQVLAVSKSKAITAFEQGRLYRLWVSRNGGVYVPATGKTPPNPLLAHVPERDVTTTTGRALTLVNATYMARQVYESALQGEMVGRVHLTSLDPLRPENRPDPWEEKALHAFEGGAKEVSGIEVVNGRSFMRLERVAFTEAACLKCHLAKGTRVGAIIGGVGVTVPISDILDATRQHVVGGAISYAAIWSLGLGMLIAGTRRISRGVAALQKSEEDLSVQAGQLAREIDQRQLIQEQLAGKVQELETTMAKVKQLEGILPICMYCKKIRDDGSRWREIEHYICEHSEADFSHSICPSCYDKAVSEIDQSS